MARPSSPPPPAGPADPTLPLPAAPPGPPPGPPPGEPPPSRAVWPWLLLLLLVLVLIGLGALFFATHHDNNKATRTVAATKNVPAVVGFTKTGATQRLTQAGFEVQVRSAPSAKPKDRVIAQAPEAGAKLSRGGTVALTVSSGPPKQSVPDVVGMRVSEAIAKLKIAHLDSRQKVVFARAARGTVVKQTPPAGAELKKGAPVQLEVSKGPQRVAIPAVVGRTRDDAVAALKKAGLVAAVFSVPSTEQQGLVVAQDPQPGGKAAKGSRVRLNVSQGAPQTTPTPTTPTNTSGTTAAQATTVTVPRLVGLKQLAAQRKLQALGLRVRTVYVPSTKPQGTVVAQRPAPGATADRGARVRINVSNGPNPQALTAVPDVTGEDEASATSDLQAAGFRVQVVDQPTSDPNQDGIVLDEDPVAGTRIPAGSQVTIFVGRTSG
ncbi:MAG TPA: PASTA domain-containing protein [Gaiellaceae bacterium]